MLKVGDRDALTRVTLTASSMWIQAWQIGQGAIGAIPSWDGGGPIDIGAPTVPADAALLRDAWTRLTDTCKSIVTHAWQRVHGTVTGTMFGLSPRYSNNLMKLRENIMPQPPA